MITSNFVSAWRGFGSSTALAAVVIAVLGSALERIPLVAISIAITVWIVVNLLYVLFYFTFQRK